MSSVATNLTTMRLKAIGFWLLKIVLALLFVMAGTLKLIGLSAMVKTFDLVGLGQWFRYVTGALELLGAGLLVWPTTRALGALLLAAISLGALIAQLAVLHEDAIHAVVLVLILVAIAWACREQLRVGRA
jgi:putative oxidoreductase